MSGIGHKIHLNNNPRWCRDIVQSQLRGVVRLNNNFFTRNAYFGNAADPKCSVSAADHKCMSGDPWVHVSHTNFEIMQNRKKRASVEFL